MRTPTETAKNLMDNKDRELYMLAKAYLKAVEALDAFKLDAVPAGNEYLVTSWAVDKINEALFLSFKSTNRSNNNV